MKYFHGWTDNQSIVIVTYGSTRKYGIAKLNKDDQFNLLRGTQIALCRLFLTPKTLVHKPKLNQAFDIKVSPHDIYYIAWQILIVAGIEVQRALARFDKHLSMGRTIEILSRDLKLQVVLSAPGGHIEYHNEIVPNAKVECQSNIISDLASLLYLSDENRRALFDKMGSPEARYNWRDNTLHKAFLSIKSEKLMEELNELHHMLVL